MNTVAWSGRLVALVTLFLCPSAVLPAIADVSQTPGGCIDKEVHICLENLQAGFIMSRTRDVEDQIRRNAEVDINGKRIMPGNSLMIAGTLKGSDGPSTLRLMYSDSNIVERAEISLPVDPTDAHTLQDYEKSNVLAAVTLIIGPNCPDATGVALYKFIENVLKPQIVHNSNKTDFDEADMERRYLQTTPRIDLCAWKVSYTNLMGHDTEQITEHNLHGAFRVTTLTFSH